MGGVQGALQLGLRLPKLLVERPDFVALALGLSIVVLVIRAWKNRPAPALADGLRPVRGAELEQFRDQARKETDL